MTTISLHCLTGQGPIIKLPHSRPALGRIIPTIQLTQGNSSETNHQGSPLGDFCEGLDGKETVDDRTIPVMR